MIPIVSVVGKSDSGKTTLLEKLIVKLTQRGYKVASVKHDVHDFEIDQEGKDSWRHKKAGARTTIISSPHKVAVISDTDRDLNLSALRERFIVEDDIIISEGYFRDQHPKIEVSQEEVPNDLLCTNNKTLIAVVSTHSMKLPVPWFHLENVKGITDFIETRFLKNPVLYQTLEKRTMKGSSHYTQQPVTGIILAGGKNIRMGKNKAFLEIDGQRIIDRTVELLKGIFSQVILVTNTPLEYSYLDIETVIDIVPKRGALIGIYTGLFYSSHPYCFVTACDMPFLNKKVIEHMITISKNYDVVIPHLDDGYHSLHAIYSKKCMKSIENLIHEDNLKIINFLDTVKVKEVTSDDITPLDPTLNSFLNINTPEDLARIKRIAF